MLWLSCESACHIWEGIFSGCWFSITPLTCSSEEALLNALLARSDTCPTPQLLRVPFWFRTHAHCMCCFLLGARATGFTQPAVRAAPEHAGTRPLQFFLSAHTRCTLCLDPFIFHSAPYDQIYTGCGLHRPWDKGFSRAWRAVLAASRWRSARVCAHVGYVTVLDVQHPCLCWPARHHSGKHTHSSAAPLQARCYTQNRNRLGRQN